MHHHLRRLHLPLVLVLVFACVLLTTAPPAHAANPSAGNQNQLINAINTVNSAGAGTHTISLTADITLTAALPALANTAAAEIVFDGNGHTLTGDATHTILKINPGATVRVRDVTLTTGGSYSTLGGAIYNRGQLTVEDAWLRGNSGDGGGGIYVHGGSGNAADLTLDHVVLQSNGASGGGGGGLAAVADGGEVSVTITRSVLLENDASGGGGGITLNGGGGEARLTVDSTAIIRNTSMGTGSGVRIVSNGGVAVALLLNTTVSSNENVFGGGGIAIYENSGSAELGLAFSTVTYNVGLNGSAIFNSGAEITLATSIISGVGPACATASGPFTATSAGYNLGDDDTCDLDAATDIPDGQTFLQYLQPVPATYGETHAHPLDALSDAQQAIPNGVLGCGTTVAQDQRGEPRPKPGQKCDIGAYESDAAATCVPPLTASDETSLDAAIVCVNAGGPGTHTITLTADFVLTRTPRFFNNSAATEIVLDGGGHTIDGTDNGPMVTVESGTKMRVRDVTLTEGNGGDGGIITSNGTLTVENSRLMNTGAFRGGAIFASGNVTITNSTFGENRADYGGAVAVLPFVGQSATLTIHNSVFEDNNGAINGGAIYVVSSTDTTVNVTLTDVTIQRNHSTDGSAGVDLIVDEAGELTARVSGSRIIDNAGYRGGLGVISAGGVIDVTVAGSTVARNRSTATGGIGVESASGGLYVRANQGGTAALTVFNSTLSGNSTSWAGGGLLVAANGGTARTTVSYSTLAGNTSAMGGGGIHTATDGNGTATVTLSAAIITNGEGAGPDCARPSGSILSDGYNLAGDGTCFLTQASDLPASNAGLLPLALNAPGNTPTHALGDSSPALDHIPTGALGCGAAVAADQRGAARPQPAGGACDIGAYERAAIDAKYRLLLPVAIR